MHVCGFLVFFFFFFFWLFLLCVCVFVGFFFFFFFGGGGGGVFRTLAVSFISDLLVHTAAWYNADLS